MLLQNLHRRYLYIIIKLPHLSDLEQRIPDFPNCHNYSSLHTSNPDPLLDDTPTNNNELHQVICNNFKIDYFQEMDIIIKLQNRLECKINYTLPALLPNKINTRKQGLATSGEGIRNKRAIPALAIIQGVAAIGGMMIKGINALVDAKRASSFNNAIKLINENVQITHDRLITLENRTTMMAKAIMPVLKDFKQQINNTNDRLNRQYRMMTKAHDRYNRLFRQTHKTFQIHHLVLLMVKDYITILVGTLQRIHRQYVRYESALDNTLIGIEHLNSGYLTHRILDPKIIAQYLEAVEDDLEETAPAFEPVFTNVYQYYGNSLISFTNIIDNLLLQLLILIKLKVQVPMSLFSIETAPVPLDAETYLGEKREYTQIILETELIALTKSNYIPLTQAQISLCAKIGYMYYCEYAHLLKKRTEHTYMSAIYYDQGSDIKVKQCKTIVTFDTIPESKILDAGDLLILSTIACKDISRVFEIEYSTYRILNRLELCECSLTAGNYLLSYTNINCGNAPDARDGYFTTYYSFNKIVLDVITEKIDIQVDENTRNQAALLHDDIPGYDLPTIDFVDTTTDQDKDVSILEEDNLQIYAHLNNVLVHMIDKQQTAIFKSNQDFNKNKEKISQYMKYAENWQVASVISSYTTMACDVLLIVAMIAFLLKYRKTMQSMLAAFLQTNTKNTAIQSVQADRIGRTYPPLFTINLPKEEEIMDDLREITTMEYVVQVIMIIVCIAIVLIIMYFCYTKCRHTHTIFKYCFPFFLISRIVRTSRRTDLIVEVTNVTKGNGIWAHFVSTGCFPTQIQLSRPIQKDDVQIETVCCIFKRIRINWSNINVTGISETMINMPDTAYVSIFMDNDLTHITEDHFEIKLIARLLDQMHVVQPPVFPPRYDDAPPSAPQFPEHLHSLLTGS